MKAPNPGKGWRLLKVGEELKDGDEVCCHGVWFKTKRIGETVLGKDPNYRRRGESIADKQMDVVAIRWYILKNAQLKRLALRMSKAKTIREAREIYKKRVGK